MVDDHNGLELVAELRIGYPGVPVVLITGQGSEALAVQALEEGAASYVPKAELSEKILDTVKQVINVARADRSYRELTQRFTSSRLTVELDNDPALITPLVNLLQQMLDDMGVCDANDRMHVGIALEEALLNALYHGNLEIPADVAQQALSEHSQGRTSVYVDERRAQAPYRDRRIYVEAEVSRAAARFVIRDEGPGFPPTGIPRPHDPKTLAEGGGRGIVLISNFMDEVSYNDAGNEVTMTKRKTGAA